MRILYGIAAEGMGHATRAKPILDELVKNNDVHILTGSRAFKYLSKSFRAVHRVFNFHIIYRKNSVSILGIVFYNVMRLPLIVLSFMKTIFLALTLRPQLIISDFDSHTAYAGMILGIPVVSIDNQHILTRTIVNYPRCFSWEAAKTRLVTTMMVPYAKLFIVTTFFFPQRVLRKTRLVPPIVRQELLKQKITEGKHVLVYQTSKTNKKLFQELRKLPEQFIVYGQNRKSIGNLTFKPFSEEEMYRDLASCKAVITNGGFSLMSEALTLGKPVLSEPVKKQFEQILNGLCLEKEGFGKTVLKIDAKHIRKFLAYLKIYRSRLRKMQFETGVEQTVALIEQVSSEVQRSSVQKLSREASPLLFQSKH